MNGLVCKEKLATPIYANTEMEISRLEEGYVIVSKYTHSWRSASSDSRKFLVLAISEYDHDDVPDFKT